VSLGFSGHHSMKSGQGQGRGRVKSLTIVLVGPERKETNKLSVNCPNL
jgi:hypothetical protein